MLELQLNPSHSDSVANVSDKLVKNGVNGVECGTDDRGNGTSIEDESDWITNALNSVIQTDDLDYVEESIIDVAKTESTDTTAAKNGDSSNANEYEIETDTIVTQNIKNARNFNDV